MGFFDDIFNEDMIWVVLLLILVFLLPQKRSQPIFKNKSQIQSKDECINQPNTICSKDIICRNTRGERERRRLVY